MFDYISKEMPTTSLGQTATTDTLYVNTLGSSSKPVHTIHRASEDHYQNDLKFIEQGTNETRLSIATDGHLKIQQDLELYDGPINTGTKRFSIGLDSSGNNFVIRDEVANEDVFVINADGTGSQSEKQDTLVTSGGLNVNSTVLDSFALTTDGDGTNYATRLLTAKAVEDWFETVQPNLVQLQAGQSGPAFRVSTISLSSPSAQNVPSCSAVANYTTARLANYLTKDRKSTRLNSSHMSESRMPSSA